MISEYSTKVHTTPSQFFFVAVTITISSVSIDRYSLTSRVKRHSAIIMDTCRPEHKTSFNSFHKINVFSHHKKNINFYIEYFYCLLLNSKENRFFVCPRFVCRTKTIRRLHIYSQKVCYITCNLISL